MNAKNKIILVLMLLLGTDALGQFQASFEISGSINSFQADSQNDNIPVGTDVNTLILLSSDFPRLPESIISPYC